MQHPTHEYAEAVVSGDVVAGRPVVWACERHLADLEREDVWFDEAKADRVFEFFESLPHYEGRWESPTLVLEPWQKFVLGSVFGWLREDEDGLPVRRFRWSWVEVARKNGKTFIGAGVGLYMAAFDGELGAQVYSAATKRDQARLMHRGAIEIRRKSPTLQRLFGQTRDRLYVEDTASFYAPLGADHDTEDGLNPHAALVDEIHAHKDDGMWNILASAMGSRRQPLLFAITTAGLKGGFGKQQHDYHRRVVDPDSGVTDDSTFVYLAELDEDDDPYDERVWVKANPNLGVSVRWDYMRDRANRARQNPRESVDFLTKNLNRWQEVAIRWLSMDDWDACAESVPAEALRGEECYGGLDLSTTTDMTAFALYFPKRKAVLVWYWLPEEGMRKRVRRDQVPYDIWAEQGHIEITDGARVDYGAVRRKLSGMVEREVGGKTVTEKESGCLADLFDIRSISFDPWGAMQLATKLRDTDGLHMLECRQGFGSLSEPSKELEGLVADKVLRHGGNPVLRWNAQNAAAKTDPAGNVKPDKAKSTERIDGLVALVMALSQSIRQAERRPSRWEDPDADVVTVG